jgi:hypothetical protein
MLIMKTGIMAGLLVNSTWIQKYLSNRGGSNGTTNDVNPSLTGMSHMKRDSAGYFGDTGW